VPTMSTAEPLAVETVRAIQGGDVTALRRLLADHPGLANARFDDGRAGRTPLHVATDWPGHFPNGAETVHALVEAGADVHAPMVGPHRETPLHWAASTDDVPVLDALLDAGADIDAPGSVIDGGGPLSDAVAFGQWNAARRLVERGARTALWHAAALGVLDRVEAAFAGDPAPTSEEVTNAFWCACHSGQRAAAERLLARGADPDWIGHEELTALDTARRTGATDVAEWLIGLGARSTQDGQ
jgi:uncharacterized protein